MTKHNRVEAMNLSEYPDLKTLERKAYTSYHQDGIIDIFLGLAILTFGVLLLPFLIESTYYLWGGVLVIWVISYAGVKRAITVPRIGYVEFKQGRRLRVMFLVLFLFVSNLVIFLITAFGLLTPEMILLLNQYGLLIIAIVVGGLFVLFGWVVQIYRLFGYGLLTFLGFVIAHVFALHFSYPIIVLGLVISVTGFVMLARFLQKYHKSEPQEESRDLWENKLIE